MSEGQVAKIAEICLRYSNMQEENKKLLKENEDLSRRVRALEHKQEQLNSELLKKDQLLSKRLEEVHVSEQSLQEQRAEVDKKWQEKCNQIGKLLQQVWVLVAHGETYTNSHIFHTEAPINAFDLIEGDCTKLKRKLQRRNDELTAFGFDPKPPSHDLKNMSLTTLEEAAEEDKSTSIDLENSLIGLTNMSLTSLEEAVKRKLTLKSVLSRFSSGDKKKIPVKNMEDKHRKETVKRLEKERKDKEKREKKERERGRDRDWMKEREGGKGQIEKTGRGREEEQ